VISLQSSVVFENSYGVRINMYSKSFIQQLDSLKYTNADQNTIQFESISRYSQGLVVSKFKDYMHHSLILLSIPFVLVIELSKASFTTFAEHYFSENNYYPIYGLDGFHGFWLYPYPYGWNIDMEQEYSAIENEPEAS
jgi:hypothetical protein